jgi:outer membrane lipoprotein
MKRDPFVRCLLPLAALALLAGCATAPKPLQGEFSSSSPGQDAPEGTRVRWGGTIVEVEPKQDVTCFQILSRELGPLARPREGDVSEGRFIACRSGFYDPAIFDIGREVTVVGNRSGVEVRRIGEYDYTLPRVAADVVYLWPVRYSFDEWYPSPSFWGPGWGPGWGWYGFYHRPFIHRHHIRRPRTERPEG